jgi:hypothetical protein
MQLSRKVLLFAIPSSLGVGIASISHNLAQPQPQAIELPTEWKVQSVPIPAIVNISAHQVLLERQKQLTNRDFSCDCNGCRVAAAQVGININ